MRAGRAQQRARKTEEKKRKKRRFLSFTQFELKKNVILFLPFLLSFLSLSVLLSAHDEGSLCARFGFSKHVWNRLSAS